MSDKQKTPKNNPGSTSEMYRLSREIEKLVARSMNGEAESGERDSIHYLSRKRAELLGQPPKRKRQIA